MGERAGKGEGWGRERGRGGGQGKGEGWGQGKGRGGGRKRGRGGSGHETSVAAIRLSLVPRPVPQLLSLAVILQFYCKRQKLGWREQARVQAWKCGYVRLIETLDWVLS